MFNFRATDVDDLMMNTLGTVIGFGIYYILFVKIFKKKESNNSFRSKLRMGSSYKSVFYSGSEFVDLTVLTIVSYAIIGSLVRNYCFLFI